MQHHGSVKTLTKHAVCCTDMQKKKFGFFFFFHHLTDLNSVSSCTVVISHVLQGSRDQCSWCLAPPETGPIIAPVHISGALQPMSHHFLIPDLWLQGSWVLELYVTHAHTHTHTHTPMLTKSTKHKLFVTSVQQSCSWGSQTCLQGRVYHTLAPLFTCRLAHKPKRSGQTWTLSALTQVKYKWKSYRTTKENLFSLFQCILSDTVRHLFCPFSLFSGKEKKTICPPRENSCHHPRRFLGIKPCYCSWQVAERWRVQQKPKHLLQTRFTSW